MHNKRGFSGFFFFSQKELWHCQLLIKGLFLLLRKSMNREKVKFRQSTKYHCKLKENVFTDAPKLVWMFSLSTSMQCKYCFYPLRKADMLTPHLFCSLAPSILPTPNIHGFIDCRSRAAVKGEWKAWRPQRTGHFPWSLDRRKLDRACLVTFSRWLASSYELKSKLWHAI